MDADVLSANASLGIPIGQQLWLKWFETLKDFPPMQAPSSYNLTQVMEQVKAGSGHASE